MTITPWKTWWNASPFAHMNVYLYKKAKEMKREIFSAEKLTWTWTYSRQKGEDEGSLALPQAKMQH